MDTRISQKSTPDQKNIAQSAFQSDLTHQQLIDCVEVGKAITAELEPEKLLSTIMDKVSKLLPSETWSLLLLDDGTQTLRFEINIDLDASCIKDYRLSLGQGVAGRAALQQRLIVVENVAGCDFFDNFVDKTTGHRTHALICVPILFAGQTLGVLEIVNPKRITPTTIALLTLLSDYLAIAIENTRRFKKIQDLAFHDNLTGLYNQRYLYQILKALTGELKTTDAPLSLIFMDLDDFKDVVDSLGHLNGSRALKEVGQRIHRCLVKPAFGVAYGGDEFVVVLPGHDRHEATRMADQIRGQLKADPFLVQWGHTVSLTASFGVATYPDDAKDYTELLTFADQAMFNAKNNGKNKIRTRGALHPDNP